MKISLVELEVLLDTAKGSLSIADRRDSPLFNYDLETRRKIVNLVVDRMRSSSVEVEED